MGFLGIAPTGKRVELKGISTYHIVEDQIVESTIFRERMDLKLGCKVVRPSAQVPTRMQQTNR